MGLQRCQRGKCILTNQGNESEKVEEKNYVTKRRETYDAFEILALPILLIYEILSRLPVDSILCCKYLCKTFLKVITDPYFIEKARIIEHGMVVVDKYAPFNIFTFNIPDLERPYQNDREYFYSWRTLSKPNSIENEGREAYILGSCNGLVCVCCYSTTDGHEYYICNPILGEYMAISPPRSINLFRLGFGFCKKTEQYKVIRFHPDFCYILTLGQDNWRNIDNIPYPSLNSRFVGPSFNEYLHWNTGSWTLEKRICSLNLETEELKYIPLPTDTDQDLSGEFSEIELAVLDGLFCIGYMVDDDCKFKIFAMKDYGVKESWTKMVTIDLALFRNPIMVNPRLLNNGIVLFGRSKDPLTYYNSRNGMKKVIMSGGQQYNALDYFPTLISLKNIAGAKNVEIVRSKRHRTFVSDEKTPFLFHCK